MPRITTLPDGKRIIDTGLPQRHIKNIWLEMHKEMNQKILDAILNSNPTDRKVERAIKFSISMILDEDVRTAAKEKAAKLIKERTEGKELANDVKAEIVENVYIEVLEELTDYVDMAFGVSHRIAIGLD